MGRDRFSVRKALSAVMGATVLLLAYRGSEGNIRALFSIDARRAIADFLAGFWPPEHSFAFLTMIARPLVETVAIAFLGITLALVRGHSDLNLRSILVHNFGDALSNIAIIVGAVIMHYTGATWIDPLLGLAIGLLVLYSSIGILRESSHILLEGRPKGTRVEEVARAILGVDQVMEVHDIHIWSLGGAHNAMSCHARIPDMHMDRCEDILTAIQKKMAEEYGIEHITVQLERAGLPATSGYVMPEPLRKP